MRRRGPTPRPSVSSCSSVSCLRGRDGEFDDVDGCLLASNAQSLHDGTAVLTLAQRNPLPLLLIPGTGLFGDRKSVVEGKRGGQGGAGRTSRQTDRSM